MAEFLFPFTLKRHTHRQKLRLGLVSECSKYIHTLNFNLLKETA
jgi:hypothetical protein